MSLDPKYILVQKTTTGKAQCVEFNSLEEAEEFLNSKVRKFQSGSNVEDTVAYLTKVEKTLKPQVLDNAYNSDGEYEIWKYLEQKNKL